MKFDFTTPTSENGYYGYTEITLSRKVSMPPVVLASMSTTVQAGISGFIVNISDLVAGRSYLLQSTTNLATMVWSTETNFVATQVTTVFTNSTSDAQKFFRIVGY